MHGRYERTSGGTVALEEGWQLGGVEAQRASVVRDGETATARDGQRGRRPAWETAGDRETATARDGNWNWGTWSKKSPFCPLAAQQTPRRQPSKAGDHTHTARASMIQPTTGRHHSPAGLCASLIILKCYDVLDLVSLFAEGAHTDQSLVLNPINRRLENLKAAASNTQTNNHPFGVIAPPSSQWRWLLTVPSHWVRRSAQRARRRDMAVALSMSDSDPVVAVASVARSLPGVGSHAKLSFCQLNSLAETLRPSLVAMPRRVSWISSRTGSHSGGIGW